MAKKLVNHALVRRQFHEKNVRVPRGFLGDAENLVQVLIRRARDGEIKIDPDLKKDGDMHVKVAPLMDVLQMALKKKHVRDYVIHINAMVASRVGEAVLRRQGKSVVRSVPVPSRIMRSFLRSKESRKMSMRDFFRKWQDAKFREEWIKGHRLPRKKA